MSIDPTKMVGGFRISPPQTRAVDSLNRNTQGFNQVLDDTVNQLKIIENSQLQAVELANIAQLQMLQRLFSIEDETDADDIFSGFKIADSMQQLAMQQGQIIDKYYAPRELSLLKPVPLESDQIAQMIDHVAEKISLAPELIHSVVSAESAYNPTAVSHAGAQGLMQLMPETAQELGVKDSFDPLQNLLGGSKYLKQLLEKYDGDLDHALAAYNWGQGNVDRHGLENLPKETRDYLVKIKGLLEKQSA